MDTDSSSSSTDGEGEIALPPRYRNRVYKCPICIKTVTRREPVATSCGHIFCKKCIRRNIISSRKCPLCKKALKLSTLRRIYL